MDKFKSQAEPVSREICQAQVVENRRSHSRHCHQRNFRLLYDVLDERLSSSRQRSHIDTGSAFLRRQRVQRGGGFVVPNT